MCDENKISGGCCRKGLAETGQLIHVFARLIDVSRGLSRGSVGYLLGAAFFAFVALLELGYEINVANDGVVADGTVDGVHRGGTRTEYVDVEFTTRSGRIVHAEIFGNSWGGRTPDPGDYVRIRYDPDDPKGTAVRADRNLFATYFESILLLCGALVFVLIWVRPRWLKWLSRVVTRYAKYLLRRLAPRLWGGR